MKIFSIDMLQGCCNLNATLKKHRSAKVLPQSDFNWSKDRTYNRGGLFCKHLCYEHLGVPLCVTGVLSRFFIVTTAIS